MGDDPQPGGEGMTNPQAVIELLDWKRRIAELYAYVRDSEPAAGWQTWRDERDHLFATHPQSPLQEDVRAGFEGLDLHDYDPGARVLGTLVPAPQQELRIPSSTGEELVLHRSARVEFHLGDMDLQLDVFWTDGYGGGLFLPFRDATSGKTTYGAGRYLYDTVKGADLGDEDGRLVLDFNFAYNPSCAYDPRWSCPLAPPANLLEQAVEAGERTPPAGAAGHG